MSSLASSSKRSAICSHCDNPSKYTCPRCATQTCSLPCSKTHKSSANCNGIRDPARYVPMNQFGYGKLMDDYVYLEQGKRKADEWGKGVGMVDDGKRTMAVGKRDGLRNELRKRGCAVDFLPEGMERREQNTSSWNPKTQTLQLTIQLVLPNQTTIIIPRTILTASAASTQPATPVSLLTIKQCQGLPHANDLVFAIPFYQSVNSYSSSSVPASADVMRYFKPLEYSVPLADQLLGLAFLEYPTIHLVGKAEWEAKLADSRIVIASLPEVTQSPSSIHPAQTSSRAANFGSHPSKQQDQARDSGWGERGVKRPAPAAPVVDLPAAKRPAVAVASLVDYASDSEDEFPELGIADDTPGELVIDERVLDALLADQAVRV